MADDSAFGLQAIGVVRSALVERKEAPRQGDRGGVAARVEIASVFAAGLEGIEVGQEVILLTWLHQAERGVLRVHPGHDASRPMRGVFATRSPDRPTPIGLHRVRVTAVEGRVLMVEPLEAVDGTPVVDIKPVRTNCMDA